MTEELRKVWNSVQKAETMIVQAGVRLRPVDPPSLQEGLRMDRALRPIFACAVYGFDPRQIRAVDYLVRHPFSRANAIEKQLRALVEAGVFTGPAQDMYAVTDEAEAQLRQHTERVGESIDRLDPAACVSSPLDGSQS